MDYYDPLETRDPQQREETLLAALPWQVARAKERAPGFARILADADPRQITTREILAKLPVTRKSELPALQKSQPPFGGLAATPAGQLARIFMSPGPIFDPEGRRKDYWRMGRALYAAGFRAGDVIQNCFSYHFTPAASMMEGGAHALGCAIIPAGTGQTELQLQALAALRPAGYAGTPSFLKIIVEKAIELGADISSLNKALVSAEALPGSLRAWLKERGIRVQQTYASAELGNIAYESQALEGLILDEELILEIVRPGSGDPVAPGEVGEVVITCLNPDYPLIRFGTGDLSAVLPGISPCGRTNVRIRGWMGRADQTTKVKGMFVHPAQVAEVVRRHPEIARARLVVEHDAAKNDRMILQCELKGGGSDALTRAIGESLREITTLRGSAAFLPAGSLPNDGKVIDDTRRYD